jgi:transcription-repair coupling factor (superfamily II helicase)
MVPTSSTSLTLRALLKSAARRAGLGVQGPGVLSGLPAQAKAFFAAAAARDATVLLVVPTDADVEQMTSDVAFFLAGLESLSAANTELAVLPFPSHEVDPYRGLAPHFDVASARARALHALATGAGRVVVASAAALLPRLSAPDRLLRSSRTVRPGDEIDPRELAGLLVDAGFSREDPVDEHGEFCVRGGIVDLFPAGDAQPTRLEFVGDSVESIRHYDPATQRSIVTLDRAAVVPLRELFPADGGGEVLDRSSTIFDYLARTRSPRFILVEPEEAAAHARKLGEHAHASYADAGARGERVLPPEELLLDWSGIETRLQRATVLEELGIGADPEPSATREGAGAPRRHIPCQPALEFRGRVGDWVEEIRRCRERGETVLFVAATSGRAERTVELLRDYDILALPIDRAEDTHAAAVLVATGYLSRGFRLPEGLLQLYAETDVFEEERKVHERRRSAGRAFLSDFRDLKVGDLVVHVDHGIGVFVGLKQIAVGPRTQEFMELRYHGDDKLFVPVERLDLVQKYTGAARPSLDKLGGTTGKRPRRASRRPCATWRRSCSSSTRRARRLPATPSAPTRTGTRSSTRRSSTS